ncbi:MAG: Ig-like domain repeat protein [Acidobacteriales bacterium]|nr:Ig-like domain repeat protein [Terriglobales bacterium]
MLSVNKLACDTAQSPIRITIAAALFAFTIPLAAQHVIATIPTDTGPVAVAINPITNKYFVANSGNDTVSVIDGLTYAKSDVSVGSSPSAVAVDTENDLIYVTNQGSDDLTVINGVTLATSTVATGTAPVAVAVNPLTRKIYVANQGSDNVTVIDGLSLATSTIAVGAQPVAVAINIKTDLVYVANAGSGDVTVIDGSSGSTATVTVDSSPSAVVVNPVTGQVYVANSGSGTITKIDGATNAATTITVGSGPSAIAVNPVTGFVYVANEGSGDVTVIDGTTDATSTIVAGTGPKGITVNAITNRVYVANHTSANVTVIDGDSKTASTLAAGASPAAVAVNPITNRVFIANGGSGDVTVIDGNTYVSATAGTGPRPLQPVVNPASNKIYVPIFDPSDTVGPQLTLVDGATNTSTTLPIGELPTAITLNPATNRVYLIDVAYDPILNVSTRRLLEIDGDTDAWRVITTGLDGVLVADAVHDRIYLFGFDSILRVFDGATDAMLTAPIPALGNPTSLTMDTVRNLIFALDRNNNALHVIDGFTFAVTTVPTGNSPNSLGVDTVTGRIFVSNEVSNSVMAIDPVTLNTSTVSVGAFPRAIAIDPLTRRVFVGNIGSDSVTVIDADTLTTQTIATAPSPNGMAVNPNSGQIYVALQNSNTMLVIDSATLATTTVPGAFDPTSGGPLFAAFNPVTGRAYITYFESGIAAVEEQAVHTVPLVTSITPLAGNVSIGSEPTFTFTVESTYAPSTPAPRNLYYQLDFSRGRWQRATRVGSDFAATLQNVPLGTHILYAFATDGQESTSASTGSSITGAMAAYVFTVVPSPTTIALSSDQNPADFSNTVTITATVSPIAVSTGSPTGTVQFQDAGVSLGSPVTLDGSGEASLQLSSLSVGLHNISAIYSGAPGFTGSASATLIQQVNALTTALIFATDVTYGQNGMVTVGVTGLNGSAAGDVGLSVDGTAAVSMTLDSNGSAAFDVGKLSAGDHALHAESAAQGLYAATSASGILKVLKAPLNILANSSAKTHGAPNPAFTGLVAITQNGDVITATYTSPATTLSPVGTYPITPEPAGAAISNYAITLFPGTLTVTRAPSVNLLASSQNPSNVSSPVTFTAAISSAGLPPTGVVTFFDGTTALGSQALDANGMATFSTSTLSQAQHSITASYGGDENHLGADAAISQIVDAGFTLAAAPPSATIRAGQTATFTITLTPRNGFAGSINLGCAALPAQASCIFTQTTLTPNGNTPVSTTLRVVTTGPNASLHSIPGPGYEAPFLAAWALGGGLIALAGIPRVGRKRSFPWLTLCLALVTLMPACGGGSARVVVNSPPTPSGQSTVSVRANGMGPITGASQTLDISITVQP